MFRFNLRNVGMALAAAMVLVLTTAKNAEAQGDASAGVKLCNQTNETIRVTVWIGGNASHFDLQPKGKEYSEFRWTFPARDGIKIEFPDFQHELVSPKDLQVGTETVFDVRRNADGSLAPQER